MGRLTNDTYLVSHLVVPRQTGSADRCDTEDEEGIWKYQTDHDLICVGELRSSSCGREHQADAVTRTQAGFTLTQLGHASCLRVIFTRTQRL